MTFAELKKYVETQLRGDVSVSGLALQDWQDKIDNAMNYIGSKTTPRSWIVIDDSEFVIYKYFDDAPVRRWTIPIIDENVIDIDLDLQLALGDYIASREAEDTNNIKKLSLSVDEKINFYNWNSYSAVED